jgi:hypothetical protein
MVSPAKLYSATAPQGLNLRLDVLRASQCCD